MDSIYTANTINTNEIVMAKAVRPYNKGNPIKKLEKCHHGKNKIGCITCSPSSCRFCSRVYSQNTIRNHIKKEHSIQVSPCDHGHLYFCKKCHSHSPVTPPPSPKELFKCHSCENHKDRKNDIYSLNYRCRIELCEDCPPSLYGVEVEPNSKLYMNVASWFGMLDEDTTEMDWEVSKCFNRNYYLQKLDLNKLTKGDIKRALYHSGVYILYFASLRKKTIIDFVRKNIGKDDSLEVKLDQKYGITNVLHFVRDNYHQ